MVMSQGFMLPDIYTMATRPPASSYPSYGIRVSDIPNAGFGLQYSVGTDWFSLARIQSTILSLTSSNATANIVWTFPVAYPAGTIPRCQGMAITAAGVTDTFNVQQEGAATNTQVTFRVSRQAPTLVSLLGLTIGVFASLGTVQLEVQAAIP